MLFCVDVFIVGLKLINIVSCNIKSYWDVSVFSKLEVSDVQAKLLKHAGVEGVEPVVKKERSQSRERSHSRASSASSKGSKDRKGRYVT